MGTSRGIQAAVAAAVVLGACSAFGDWVWARFIPDGAVIPGVVHGVLIFLILAAVLAAVAGTRRAVMRLVPSLPLAGLLIAAAFYPLAGLVGYIGALLATWILMWLALAILQRWARAGGESLPRAVVRGAAAALLSGLAFWAISDIWVHPAPEPNYLVRFALWTLAFLPGFVSLLLGQDPAEQ